MQLNDHTLEVLRNFSDIQSNILIEPGNQIKTLAQAGNILAKTTLTQDFPAQMLIFDLKEFLSVLKLLTTPDISFHKDHVVINDGVGRSRIKYYFADENTLTVPKKDIVMPDAEITFELDEKTLNSLRSASSVLGHEQFTTSKVDGTIRLTVEDKDPSNKTSNKFSVDVAGVAPDVEFCMRLDVANVKVIPGDYIVSMSSAKISQWKHKNFDLTYWIAVDKKSTWNS